MPACRLSTATRFPTAIGLRSSCGPRTRLDNLAPLGRFGHRVKTHGNWTLRQPFSGIMLWRDPHGQVYLVDHTGTHKITAAGRRAGPAREHDLEITVSGSAQVIELDFDRDWTRRARST